MKIIVVRSNLLEGITTVERVGDGNSNLPILKNFLLNVSDNKIKISATNLEIGATFTINGKIIEEGDTTIPIATFSNIINSIQTERVNLEKKGDGLYIKTDNYEATIQGLPASDFPIIPKVKNDAQWIEIKGEILKESLKQTLAAAHFSDLRPELNSVIVNFSLDAIKMAATDSFRLSEKTISSGGFNSNHSQPFKILIPLKTCYELERILKDDDQVRIYHDEHQIIFKTQHLDFISRLTEANFPEYAAYIPKKFNSEIMLDKNEFMSAIKITGFFSSRVGEIKIKVADNKKTAEVASADQILGDNKYILTAKIQGSAREVYFNWRYLLDGLKVLNTADVLLSLSEEGKPALLRSQNDASYLYVVMPILKP